MTPAHQRGQTPEIGLAKRVFEIAKELGVASKAIVSKCHDEGIPSDVIKNHMSSVSAGLEATIRDWFGGGGGTAIETAEKVDVEKVRAQPRRKAAKARAKPAAPSAPESESPPEPAAPPARPETAEPSRSAPQSQPTSSPAQTIAETVPATAADAGASSDAASDRHDPEVGQGPARPEPAQPGSPAHQSTAAAAAAEAAGTTESPSDAPAARTAGKPQMNVPSRPKVIKPAGPQLDEAQREKVKLSGPKVVRVEAPEPEQMRPRRSSPSGGYAGGPSTPGGAGAGGPGAAPFEGGERGPRRGQNQRRTGTGGGGAPARRRGRAGEAGPAADQGRGGRSRWSAADLAEREARLQRSGGYMKQRRQQQKRQQGASERPATPAERGGKVTISEPFTIKDLSAATGVKAADIVRALFMQGVIANINSGIDSAKAQEIMIDYDIELEVIEAKSAEDVVEESFKGRDRADERSRGPVVTILGHVDHGKTSLLDRIRRTDVAAGEAGGITQATSAFRVPVNVGGQTREVVFLDTPGHQAFTEMRSRGAQVTDIVVLVVAADDGVMPQTAESISHAKAAGVPIVVALNKIDKPEATDANIQRIMGQLAEHELNPVDWGGETEVVKTSAEKGEGITDLLEVLEYQAELLDLKADFSGPAQGTVIESRIERGRGAVANVLIQEGRLRVGDVIVAGRGFGKVRDITNDRGERLKEADPPSPVQISGIDQLPDAGDKFYVVDDLKKAEQAAEQRRERVREAELAQPKVTLDSLFARMAESEVKEILIILKADVQGSVDVLRNEIEKIEHEEVKVRVLHAAVGGITESDVQLAEASRAIVVGFNVIPSGKARQQAERKGVEIRTYKVIYDIVDDLKAAAEGMLAPELREEVIGHAQVRQVFKVSRVGAVAGCYVTDGVVERDAYIRVTRNDIVIENDRRLEQLKRFKDDAKEVRAGMECGMKIVGYDDIKEGDILECYKQVEVKRSL